MVEIRQIPVVIPAYEPDEKMIALLSSLKKEGISNLIVVDDGSGRAYAGLFDRAKREFGAIVLTHAVNLGKGRALKTAFNECLRRYPEAIGCVTADSDGQHTPECIIRCMEAMGEAPEALVLGCRNFDGDHVPARSAWGNKITCRVLKILTGISAADTQTGLRGIPRAFMEQLMNVRGERFEFETNMLLETKTLQMEIVEVPIETVYLEQNRSSHFNPIRDSARIYMIFGKFLFSSLSSSVLDLLLFGLFCTLLKGRLTAPVSYITLATAAARMVSAAYNFCINYRVVFHSREEIWKAALRYGALAAVQMACSAFLVNFVYGMVGGFEVLVKMPVDIFLFFISFLIQREFVYRK